MSQRGPDATRSEPLRANSSTSRAESTSTLRNAWATFFPLIGLAVILILTAARCFLGLPRQTLDQSARVTGLTFSGLSFLCSILAWVWFDPATPGIQGPAGGKIVAACCGMLSLAKP
jgi:hypothetical protein